jgi:hypothetical protein
MYILLLLFQSLSRHGLSEESALHYFKRTLLTHAQLFDSEPENEISLTAFRLLTMDLLVLYHVMNEGVINVLGKETASTYSIAPC